MSEVLLVLTNMPDQESAQNLAKILLEHKTAACVNILSSCISVYHWQGKIESANEVPLLIKTTRSVYKRVEELIRIHHPYELPEIIAVPVTSGLPEYLNWVVEEVSSNT